MNVHDVKLDLMKRTKKGVPMIYVGVVYWLLLGILSFIDMHVNLLGLIYLIGAGMIFPLGILVAKLLKIDFIAQDNPLSNIGGVIGGMQLLFAPILIMVFMEKIEWLPFMVAVLTGAHFLPFAPIYNSKAYIFQSVAVVLFSFVVGFFLLEQIFTILPFGVSLIYLITCIILTIENKNLNTTLKDNLPSPKQI